MWIRESGHRLSYRLDNLLEGKKKRNSIATLDGVRAIACLMVIAYHISLIGISTRLWDPFNLSHRLFGSIVNAGAAGVTLFFVLSGFLLFMPYAKSLLVEHTSWPSARRFYLRRAFRIIPAYYVCLFLLVLIAHRHYLQPAHWKELGLFLVFFMDSSSTTYQKLNGPFWTLGVEWQYYMLLPLFMLAMGFIVLRLCKGGSMRRRLWLVIGCLGVMIAWGLFSRHWGYYFTQNPTQTFLMPRSTLNIILFFTYGRNGKFLEDFAVGMLLSLLFIFAQQVSTEGRFSRVARSLAPWLWGSGILVLVFFAMWRFNQGHAAWSFFGSLNRQYNWLGELGFSLGFGLCIFAILFGSRALKRPFEWRPLRWIGLVSFSLYMWHLPLLIFFIYYVHNNLRGINSTLDFSLFWLFAFFVIIPFSAISYLLIEKPGVALGEKLWRRIEKKQLVAGKSKVDRHKNHEVDRFNEDRHKALSLQGGDSNSEVVKEGNVDQEIVKW